MEWPVLQTVVLSIILGVTAYIVSRWLRIPAILFYLISGVLFGPSGFNLITPQNMGSGLLILVEIAVAIILFEGGLALSAKEKNRTEKTAIRRILMITLPVTGIGAAVLAHFCLGLGWQTSSFFGALIVVTGPTVIGAILKSISLTPRLEMLLNWESLWGDVIGVLLSALALEIMHISPEKTLWHTIMIFGFRIITGVVLGIIGGLLMTGIVRAVEKLRDPALLGITVFAGALGLFFGANLIMEASGPLCVAIAGFVLSYKNSPESLHEIRHFKDQLASLFISFLFVLLSAYIPLSGLASGWQPMLLAGFILGAIIRPAGVWLALAGSGIPFQEKIYIGFIGPRGIIAVATAAYAVLSQPVPSPEMTAVLNLTFVIIFLSGTIATIAAKPLGTLLGVRVPRSRSGILIVGINPLSSAVAEFAGRYVPVTFLETDPHSCSTAEVLGHATVCTDLLSGDIYEEAAREGYERLIATTRNDALNELIAHKAGIHLDIKNVYRALGRFDEESVITDPTFQTQIAFTSGHTVPDLIQKIENQSFITGVIQKGNFDPELQIPLLEVLPGNAGVRILCAGETPEEDCFCLIPA